jgi:hypothetical protein
VVVGLLVRMPFGEVSMPNTDTGGPGDGTRMAAGSHH